MQYAVSGRKIRRYLYGLSALGVGAALAITSIVAGHLGNAGASAPPVLVKMVDMPASFQPAQISIKVGETVEWKNIGNSVHHASSDPSSAINPADVSNPPGAKPFDSGFLQPGQSYSYTFTVAGKYKYVCAPHETSGMSGEVLVR